MAEITKTVSVIQKNPDGTTNFTTATEKESVARRSTEPPYIKIYLNTIGAFNNIQGSGTMSVFWQLVKSMSYAEKEQLINVNGMVDTICKNANVTRPTYYRAVQELLEKGLIKRIKRGIFAVNPTYVGKGEWKHITRLVAHFDYITGEAEIDFGYDENIEKMASDFDIPFLSEKPIAD